MPDESCLFDDLPKDAKDRAKAKAVRIIRASEARIRLGEINPDAVIFDGFDEALIGIVTRFGIEPIALYDRAQCIQILMDRDGMSHEEAEEFFQFNTEGCWAGDGTPAFAEIIPEREDHCSVCGTIECCPLCEEREGKPFFCQECKQRKGK